MCQQKILEKFKNFSKNFVEYGNKACYSITVKLRYIMQGFVAWWAAHVAGSLTPLCKEIFHISA